MKTREKLGSETTIVTDGNLKYIEFDCLNRFDDKLIHCMSTRIGGVSQGECSSLNLGFNRNDSRENVINNFRLLCDSAGLSRESLVLTNQVHEIKVALIDKSDSGKGFSRQSDLTGVDGLLTVTPGVTMVTFHADCVPVFLFEPVIKAAALLHSGWRGTLKNITGAAVDAMRKLPGFDAERLVAVTGPSIGRCCFEVDEDVFKLFNSKFPDPDLYMAKNNRKWHIDLKEIIRRELLWEGLLNENIHDSGICTVCRRDLFFSHRGDSGKTGSLAAFMQIRE